MSNVFLHGTLDEDIYMDQPPGYVDSRHPHLVCKLKKSLYGLKQAPRAWYNRFSSFLQDIDFRTCTHDTSLFTLRHPHGLVIILLYVDDIVITGSSSALISTITKSMHQNFQLKRSWPSTLLSWH